MKKNILISVYDMAIGGIERSLISMLESFDYNRYNVDLLIFHHSGDLLDQIPSQVHIIPEVSQYTVFRRSMIQCLREGHYFSSCIRLISKFLAKIKARKFTEGSGYVQMQLVMKYCSYFVPAQQKEYDAAISYAWPHDILIRKVKAKKKIAWIHTDYTQLEIDNQIDLKMWEHFDYIASISEACTTSFLAKYPSLKNKIVHIENITSPAFIKKMAEEPIHLNEGSKKTFNIVSVGRLSYVKGFDMAVEALKILLNKGYTNVKWYVIGFGGYEEELKKLIAENNLEDRFILLGKKTNPYPYILACDLYVQPSRYEGKAITVTEAQILGKPILITNFPTAASQVRNGIDGIITPLGVDGIVEGIIKLIIEQDLRNQLIAGTRATDYGNSREVEKLYALI